MLPGLGGKKASKITTNMTPKTCPGGLRSLQNEDPKRCLTSASFSTNVWTIFEAQIDPEIKPKITQKSALGRPGPPRDANGRPEASRELFWSLLGSIFDPFGSNVGTMLVTILHLQQSSFFSVALVLVLGASQLLRVGGCPR